MEHTLNQIKDNIHQATFKSNRKDEDITLVAVSKTYSVETIKEAYTLGCRDFGENKVQELMSKIDQLPYEDINWHFIGHLQTNKVKYIIGKVKLIHSVDSLKLMREIEKQSEKKDTITDILVEVNVSKEESKYGFTPEGLMQILTEVATFKHIRVKGLMTVAPYVENAEKNRGIFRELFSIAVDIQKQKIDNIDTAILSMGMSNDYVIAIEQGATIIRIGSALFGERSYSNNN